MHRGLVLSGIIGLILVAGFFVVQGADEKEFKFDKDLRDNLRENGSYREDNGGILTGKKYKSYDPVKKEILIENYLYKDVLRFNLESDYEVVTLGWNDMDLIAWFNLSDFSGENFVDDVKFYDVNNNYSELDKEYIFKYKNSSNEWVEFSSLSELPNKNIEIGLFTDIIDGDKIEWVIEKDGFEFLEWALVLGTNVGFVTVAPTGDPTAATSSIDNKSRAVKDTSPIGSIKVVEIGWWCDGATEEANFEVGLYSHNLGDDEPEERLYVDDTNAKGTSAGWKTVVVDWEIDAETVYWIASQLDDTPTATNTNGASSTGVRLSQLYSPQTILVNPWGSSDQLLNNYAFALYAVVEVEDTTPPTYSQNQTNNTVVGLSTLFSILWDDNTALESAGQYIFSTNNTGAWANESVVNFTATPNWANVSKVLNSTEGLSIGYRWFATDNVGNINNTEIFTLTTTPEDTCTCAGVDTNWEIDMSDYCELSTPCDLGTGKLSFTGTGNFSCDAAIDTTDLGDPGANGILYILDDCYITVD